MGDCEAWFLTFLSSSSQLIFEPTVYKRVILKGFVRRLLLLSVFLMMLQLASGQVGGRGTLLYLDGKNVTGRAKFELKRDDLIRFDGYGLQAGSSLNLQARKNGVKMYDEIFDANSRGEIKTILFFPKARVRIKCTAYYTTKNGRERKINFFLDPVQPGNSLKTFPRGTGGRGGKKR